MKISSLHTISLACLFVDTLRVKGFETSKSPDGNEVPSFPYDDASQNDEMNHSNIKHSISNDNEEDGLTPKSMLGLNSSLRGGGQSTSRNLSFWDAIGDWFTGCPAGNEGDTCSVGCQCSGQNTCEAWSHVCRAPGKENDPCHATRPCGSPFTCEAGSHICRAPGKHGDKCHVTRPCGDGYWCVDAISAWNHQMCLPKCTSIGSDMKKKLDNDGYSTTNYPGFGQKWDNGVVPFVADCSLERHESALFSEAMKEIEDKTGVQFVRYDSKKHQNYIVLTDSKSGVASSWVGKMKVPGWQRVNLDTDWGPVSSFNVASAIHELMHALGWQHTQARPDRDRYVTINEANIKDGKKNNFDMSDSDVFQKVQKCRPYNYDSIMHYSKDAFSKNGSNTISTKDSSKQNVIGNRKGMTSQDITEIKTYYFGKPCAPPTAAGFSKKFVLINPHTGKALDAYGARCADGTNVHLWDRTDGGAQIFHYHYATNAIVNVKCNKALTVSSCKNGANVYLSTRNGGSNQKLIFYTDQTIRLQNCGKAIDVYGKYTSRGTNIWLFDVNSEWDKKWKYVYV